MVSLGGRSMNMAAAAKELGVPSGTIYARMRSHDLSQQEVVDYYTARSGEG
jgi:transcriptional regulator of acetoin/glycerol metabolism